MEIITFLSGVGSVIAVAIVVSMFRMNTRITNNEETLNDCKKQFDDVYDLFQETQRDYQEQMNELHRQLDSRFDKFENKLNNKK
tara:strand:+ start:7811 stop:8062 length:252 start_codon:yes stop_codon:yes gene_type:complete